MSLLMRTAMLQARVTPEIKQASEYILRRIGLNMTEAMELFLRRVIVDQRIPFEVIALDDAVLANVTRACEAELRSKEISVSMDPPRRSARGRQKRE